MKPQEMPQELVEKVMAPIYRQGDRYMRICTIVYFLVGLALAGFYGTWLMAFAVGLPALAMFWVSYSLFPGTLFCRCMAGVSLQAFVALFIYQMHGLAEMHFFFFIASTTMIFYQDWRVGWPSYFAIIGQHILFAYLTNTGSNLHFWETPKIAISKLAFHFGIALWQAAVASFAAEALRRRTISYHMKAEEADQARLEALDQLHLAEAARHEAEHQTRIVEQQSAALQNARDKALDAARAKSEFLANMSHEIRTPLNGVIGITALLQHTKLNEQQEEYIASLKTSGELLLTVINDVLDFSKIEARRLEINRVPFNLREAIEDVASLFRRLAMEKEIELRVELANGLEENVFGDPVRIRQILNNLCSNAIKFTSVGSVTISARCGPESDGLWPFSLAVEDTGVGIPADRLDAVFDVFTQVDGTTTRKYGGSGLGLTICRQLADLMGGSVYVESVPGLGSTFTLELPLALSEKAPLDSSQHMERALRENVAGCRVLLVEDNIVNQKVAKGMLQRWSCFVEVAVNGQEAVDKLETAEFDLVLMDCHMPVLDGYQATQIIRAHKMERVRRTPIVALTANAMSEDRAKSIEAGMDDYLSKPIDPQAMLTLIRRVASGVEREPLAA